MSELREADQSALRDLAGFGNGGAPVLSAYISLDGPEVRTPETLRQEIDSRLDEAARRLRPEAVEETAAQALGACLEQAHRALENAPLADHGLRAVAVFCREGAEPRLYGLRRPVDFGVAAALRPRPALEPLLEAMGSERWAVALVSRKHGRLFLGGETGLVELGDIEDDVHRWHSQGGWSQARYQRGVEKETADHVERVCARLFALHERRPLDALVLGGPAEIRPLVERHLHPYLREHLAGEIAVEVESATPEEVRERLEPLARERRQAAELTAVERLEAGLGTGDEAVAGIAEVQAALERRRVGTLLIAAGEGGESTERAVEEAVAQAAEVIALHDDALDRFGGIAALLRF
ncbi:MAG TPA: Vms1/Ankzf1 family peptidyl-tRNA hydrolase [Solirubrobacterales bacterium]